MLAAKQTADKKKIAKYKHFKCQKSERTFGNVGGVVIGRRFRVFLKPFLFREKEDSV